MISAFDEVVATMMAEFGTQAIITTNLEEVYNPDTSENIVTSRKIPVKAIFADYIDKRAGVSNSGNTLIQSGDKQVFVQPPHKAGSEYPLEKLRPTQDYIECGGKKYIVIAVKEYNTSLLQAGCVLYELYVRE